MGPSRGGTVTDKFQTYCTLPEGALIEEVIEIVSYINPENGERMIVRRFQGDTSWTQTFGLIEAVKAGLQYDYVRLQRGD
jgi:hypothetical protein